MSKTLYYGSGNVSGNFARENVCLTEPLLCMMPNWDNNHAECVDVCIDQISTILVDHNVGLQALEADGIIGLAPSARERFAELFIEKAYEQGVIDEPIFSFLDFLEVLEFFGGL